VPLDGHLDVGILPSETPNSQRQPRSELGGVGLPFGVELDSSDDEEGFELEPAPVLADSTILAAADYTHEQEDSCDEGSIANGIDSDDE
jgi:hypothetical protein